jgi:hypothetical protein
MSNCLLIFPNIGKWRGDVKPADEFYKTFTLQQKPGTAFNLKYAKYWFISRSQWVAIEVSRI